MQSKTAVFPAAEVCALRDAFNCCRMKLMLSPMTLNRILVDGMTTTVPLVRSFKLKTCFPVIEFKLSWVFATNSLGQCRLWWTNFVLCKSNTASRCFSPAGNDELVAAMKETTIVSLKLSKENWKKFVNLWTNSIAKLTDDRQLNLIKFEAHNWIIVCRLSSLFLTLLPADMRQPMTANCSVHDSNYSRSCWVLCCVWLCLSRLNVIKVHEQSSERQSIS